MFYDPDMFVNRVHEIEVFANLLSDPRCRLLLITGEPSIGKSCLVERMREECSKEGVTSALVDFRLDQELTRPDRVIDGLCGQIGGDFADRILQAELRIRQMEAAATIAHALSHTEPGHIEAGMIQGNIQVAGDLVEHKIAITNSSITINPARGHGLAVDAVENERDREFRTALGAYQAAQPLVLFFDHYEEAEESVARWLRRRLLNLYVEARGDCEQLWVVIAGRQVPLQAEVNQWRNLLKQQQINPLPADAIYVYWVEKRRLDPTRVSIITDASGGNPGLLVMMADNTERAGARA